MSTLFNADELKVSNTVIKYCKKCDKQKPHFIIRCWSNEKGRYRINRRCVDCKRRKDRLFGQKEQRKNQIKIAQKKFKESEKYLSQKEVYKKRERDKELNKREDQKRNWLIENQGLVSPIYLIDCKECGVKQVRRKPYRDGAICGYCHIGKAVKERKEKPTKCRSCSLVHEHKVPNALCQTCLAIKRKERICIYRSKRKALERNAVRAEPVNRIKVFDRDKWRCQMCNIKVQDDDKLSNNAAQLDHIVPLSKGGVHTYSNVRCLCRRCNNVIKSDKLIGQIVLQL
jgi:hypothetical protein